MVIFQYFKSQNDFNMKGFFLLILSILLSVIFYPLGWVYSFITFRLSLKKLGGYFFVIALSIDQLGNVVMATAFNDWFITKYGHKFGDEDQTISMVLGVNKKMGTLTGLGKWLADVLNAIDKDHVEKAIEKN